MGIFYEKAFPVAKTALKRARFEGFTEAGTEKKGFLRASGGQNCEFSGGRLSAGMGFSEYLTERGINPLIDDPDDPPRAFALLPYTDGDGTRKKALMYVSELGVSYIYNSVRNAFDFTMHVFDDIPAMVPVYGEDGTAKLAFCSADGIWLYDKATKMTKIYAERASTLACAFHERLFFVERPFCVRYCAPLAHTVWTDSADEGGHVEFPSEEGEIVGLEAMNEAVYVFRERGIVRLDARGAAREFSAQAVPYGGGKILEGSIGACGEKIFFLTEDGAYAFDGKTARRIAEASPLSLPTGRQVCEHAAYNGKYFLRYTAENGEKKLWILDAASERGYFSAPFVGALSETENAMLCLVGGKICAADSAGKLPAGEEYVFETASDFGIRGRKLWKTLILKGAGGCVAEVGNGYETKRREMTFVGGEARAEILLKGERFAVTLRLQKGSQLSGMETEFVVYG